MDKDFDNNFLDIKKNIYLFEDPIKCEQWTIANNLHVIKYNPLSISGLFINSL